MKTTAGAMQGTWHYLTLKVEGKQVPRSSLAESTIVIDGYKFRVESPEESYQGTFTIDEDETPHTIDIAFKQGPAKGKRRGIYELDEDSLKICLSVAGGDRPTSFASKPGSGHVLETLQRAPAQRGRRGPERKARAGANVKPGAKTKPADETRDEAPAKPGKSNLAELARIQGTWMMVSAERDGQPMPRSYVEGAMRIAKGDETTVLINGAVFLSARMAADPGKKPTAIDYLLTSGANRNKTQLGIYELDGDRLTLCFAKPGKDRPTDFTARAGSGRTLSVWRLAKE